MLSNGKWCIYILLLNYFIKMKRDLSFFCSYRIYILLFFGITLKLVYYNTRNGFEAVKPVYNFHLLICILSVTFLLSIIMAQHELFSAVDIRSTNTKLSFMLFLPAPDYVNSLW